MATNSTAFLEVDEHKKSPNLHRSRSGGYADYLEEQVRWGRRDRERQMKLYHDNHRSTQPAQPTDRLYVPAFDTRHRRVRSQEQITERTEELDRKYKVREAVPSPLSGSNAQRIRPAELPVRPSEKLQKKPKIKVQIHQDEPPQPDSKNATARGSPYVSPMAPSATPQLPFQYATLRHGLAQIETICTPYVDVEGADPHDLTFAKISERAKGFAFELEVWGHTVSVTEMARIDTRRRTVVEIASRTLERLIERVTDLNDACSRAKPKDLKLMPLPDLDDRRDEFNSEEDDTDELQNNSDVTESVGFFVQYQLDSIQLQLQTLKRLARSLQEATPNAKEEVIAVDALVSEVGKYFSSQDALDRYRVDTRLAGDKALEEVRYAARH